MADRRTFLEERFGDLWPAHTRAFGDLLICARKHFEGDLDKLLILAVIGSRSWDAEAVEGVAYGDYRAGTDAKAKSRLLIPRTINIQSISMVTGIPRESVRRKVNFMLDRGWIESNGQGLVATRRAASDFSALTDATFEYLSVVLDALDHPKPNARSSAGSGS